jgi:hypothetical protein
MAGSLVLASLVLVTATPLPAAANPNPTASPSFGVVAIIPLTTDLAALSTYDPANGDLYVPCQSNPGLGTNGTLRVISVASDSVIASDALGSEPGVPVVDSWNGDVYISNYGDNFTTVISGTSNEVVGTIRTEGGSVGIAFDPGNGDLYVPGGGRGLSPGIVDVISGSTNSVVASIPIGWYPSYAIYDGANGNLYVADRSSANGLTGPNEVTVISTANNRAVANVTVGEMSSAFGSVMLDASNADLYVASGGGTAVVSTTTNTVLASFPRGGPGFVDLQGNVYLYQPGFPANFTVVSGFSNTVTSTFTIGNSFWGLTYDPNQGVIFSGGFSLNVTSVETHRQIETISSTGIRGWWFQPTYVPGNGDLYGVVQGGDTSVVVIGNVSTTTSSSPSTDPLLLTGVALLGAAAGALVTFVVSRRRKGRGGTPPNPPA